MLNRQILSIIGRNYELFSDDLQNLRGEINYKVSNSRFLVIGGAGSIGQAVVREIFSRRPLKIHVVDINENNLAELVRDLRSSFGYIKGDFQTFCLDVGSLEFECLLEKDCGYDYVLNLSALKHVRSEADPYTLMRMISVNIINTNKTLEYFAHKGVEKYFSVSTDKASNPVNLMGASKLIMEKFIANKSKKLNTSSARFANVAFSDGSLLYSFNQRIKKNQPIVAPNDINRYFITPKESGELCLLSSLFGNNLDIFFPKLNRNKDLINFSTIAITYLKSIGYEPLICYSEKEAREKIKFIEQNKWPCLFSESDTTGEKDEEEFHTEEEVIDLKTFKTIGIIKNTHNFDEKKLSEFLSNINRLQRNKKWSKYEIVELFRDLIPEFNYFDKRKYLNEKM